MNVGIVGAEGFEDDFFHVGVVSWISAKKGDGGKSAEGDGGKNRGNRGDVG